MDRAKKFMEFIKGQHKDWTGKADDGRIVTIHSSKLGISAYILDPDTHMTDSATSNARTMADVWKWLSEHGVNKITMEDGSTMVKSEALTESSWKPGDKVKLPTNKELQTLGKRAKISKQIGKGIMQDYAYRKAHKVTEGLRINLEYLTLIPGEHPLGMVLDEAEALVDALISWREMETWRAVSAKDSKHQEVIPLAFSGDLSKKSDKIKVGGHNG